MKNGLGIFAGAFGVLALSWAGVVLTAHRQLTRLTQYKDPAEETLFPQPLNGPADQGRMVYQDLGCVSCHTQQVRREGFGSDIERNWGTRQSVGRDYIRDKTVFLGGSRLGPDLRNVGARSYATAAYFYSLLYAPETLAKGMPAYAFLFDVRPVIPGQASPEAIHVTGPHAPPAGYEVVPNRRAAALVAYLQDLKDTYEFPEARPFVAAGKNEGGH